MPVTKTVHATCSCADQLEVYSSFPCCCIWFASPAVIKMTCHTHAMCGHTVESRRCVVLTIYRVWKGLLVSNLGETESNQGSDTIRSH